ncbi:MAG: UbiD family decarboxylase, partial [Burkholderiales bacterium]
QTKAINVTPGGCCHWHIVASIKKVPGDGKNAIMALLSIADIKHVTIVDDDIDVFDATDVEWAIATRVQGDKDVIIIPGARAKPLDPSLAVTPPGVVPTGAKVGIDATIGEGIPRERFERIAYAYADRAKIADYVKGKADAPSQAAGHNETLVERLANEIMKWIEAEPRYYQEIAERFGGYEFQAVARAMGRLHADGKLWQDARGRACVKGSSFAAKPPASE